MNRVRDPHGRAACAECGAAVAPVLLDGGVCPQCRSARAWASFAGRPLTIAPDDVARAVALRQPPPSRAAMLLAVHWLPMVAAVIAAGCAVDATSRLIDDVALGPFAQIRAEIAARASRVLGCSAFGLVLGMLSLWLQRRFRYRHWLVLTLGLLAVTVAAATGVLGGAEWLSAVRSGGWAHFAMPDRSAVRELPAPVQRIMDATVFILASGASGDARSASMGVGSVIHSEPGVAWILTCSHVAMPYAGSDGNRLAAHAPPVVVSFADGCEVAARIEWAAQAPLDVALLRAPRSGISPTIAVREAADDLVQGAIVGFVPNPLRAGWLWHQGSVQKREAHLTPAGVYSLLFTDLPVAPGDSGSGLFDVDGRLVGLNTWAVLDPHRRAGISLPAEAVHEIFQRIRPDAPAGAPTAGDKR